MISRATYVQDMSICINNFLICVINLFQIRILNMSQDGFEQLALYYTDLDKHGFFRRSATGIAI